ncbi:TlpA family protein disulfide reductase [Haloglycomyces albus]|uniref:TlpA family protein disulfide reductase n=1 Tax=Haloglycomyces albus TaxID=526067 RepID=UPI00046CB581|nr:TlpA disulfide reductase family protein [Haloglycomyces albus]
MRIAGKRSRLTWGVVLAAVTALSACTSPSQSSSSPLEESDAAPAWEVPCGDYEAEVDIAEVGDHDLTCLGTDEPFTVGPTDQPLVLSLWASWCGPCREEMPELERFFQSHSDQVDVVGVNTGDTRDRARWFAEDFEVTFPSVFDPEEALRRDFSVPALPALVLVRPDGSIAEVVTEAGVDYETLVERSNDAFGLELSV